MQAMTSIQQTAHQQGNYLVVGLGLTGYSVANYLLSRGYRVKLQDIREQSDHVNRLKQAHSELEFFQQSLDKTLIEWSDILVVSPGITIRDPLIEQAVADGKRVIGDIELFAEIVDKPVIAITGSNGKSTVTTLVGQMITFDQKIAAVGGNLGTPALDLLHSRNDFYILELSSYQLETMKSLQPAVATVLNISEDHLDRYRDYQDYSDTKMKIYQRAKLCVSNADDAATTYSSADIHFSLTDSRADFTLLDNQQLVKHGQVWLDVDELKVTGRFNWANCLASMALADAIGVSKSAIVTALRAFTGLQHRSQWVAEIKGVEWINDSKATNPGAAKASIEGRSKPVILLAGGQSKDADVSVLKNTLAVHVKQIFLFGEDADKLFENWQSSCVIKRVFDLQQAVNEAYELAQPGDIVLLAPACASFDQFQNFSKRGEHFMQLVEALSSDE